MIKVRCFGCSHAFQLTEQTVANALAAQEGSGKPTHYIAECPRCRQAVKVPLKRVRLPSVTTLPELQTLGEDTTGEAATE